MSGEKALVLTERESYLLSRLGDAWVESAGKVPPEARVHLAEARLAAEDVTEAAAILRAALEEIAAGAPTEEPPAPDSTHGLRQWAADTTRYRLAQIARAALAATEGSKS